MIIDKTPIFEEPLDLYIKRKSNLRNKIIKRSFAIPFILFGCILVMSQILRLDLEPNLIVFILTSISIFVVIFITILVYIFISTKYHDYKNMEPIMIFKDNEIIFNASGPVRIKDICRIEYLKDFEEYSIWMGFSPGSQIIKLDKTKFTEELIEKLKSAEISFWVWKTKNEGFLF